MEKTCRSSRRGGKGDFGLGAAPLRFLVVGAAGALFGRFYERSVAEDAFSAAFRGGGGYSLCHAGAAPSRMNTGARRLAVSARWQLAYPNPRKAFPNPVLCLG
jgi:hypothetical protein